MKILINSKKNKKLKIEFLPKEDSFNNFLATINSFGRISYSKYYINDKMFLNLNLRNAQKI